ncbi:glutathione S-transferase 1-like [Musca domestica]|uniref:Glutathione S-transferase 1-like n=1 Tax=Musca domestica TaxID=7370 RepID=A0A1I8MYV5_MUSDO|nr:glutathione S-transferase 1-like [Musca domestica]
MDLYYIPSSGPCRAVEMTAKALGVELNKKFLNLRKGEQFTPEFKKLNPQHTVPTLVDGDFILWESRVIMMYLCEKFDTAKKWYPECPKLRAIVQHRMIFDLSTLYQSFADYYYPTLLWGKPVDHTKLKNIENAFKVFNILLEGKQFAAGDSVSIADISLLATVTNFDALKFDFSKYPNVAAWYERCKTAVPGYAENFEACKIFEKIFRGKL